MPFPPLIGHRALRERLEAQVRRGTLASSILLTGPPGIGKQRLALWLGQRLLCEQPNAPCGECQHCRYALDGVHPDLTWLFPMERMKESDPPLEAVAAEIAESTAARAADALYARPDGSYGIFVRASRLLVHRAAMSPSMARRKVIVVGDAERMVPQASSQEAANAFLKLLEEPPADTTIILTSSEPGALLPTIRSRVIAMRVRPLGDAEMREFLALPAAAKLVAASSADALVKLANGAPGSLLDADSRAAARARAETLLDVVTRDPDRFYRVIYSQGSTKARGAFSDTLDALSEALRERSRAAADSGDAQSAAAAAKGVAHVEEAKRDAEHNAVPHLVAFRLLSRLTKTLA